MNKQAERAQIESDEVAALKVLSTGDSAMRARNTRRDDFRVLVPGQSKILVR